MKLLQNLLHNHCVYYQYFTAFIFTNNLNKYQTDCDARYTSLGVIQTPINHLGVCILKINSQKRHINSTKRDKRRRHFFFSSHQSTTNIIDGNRTLIAYGHLITNPTFDTRFLTLSLVETLTKFYSDRFGKNARAMAIPL